MTASVPAQLMHQVRLLAAAPRLLVCSDFDGTLAPLMPRPELAQLLPGAKDTLQGLAALPDTLVAIISGRGRENLRAQTLLNGSIMLIGSHGAELPGGQADGGDDLHHIISKLVDELGPICRATPGAWLERKPFGVTVHVRQADEVGAARTLATVRSRLGRWPHFHAIEGKAVIELSASRRNKADALAWLRSHYLPAAQIIYLGDDVSDEAAFGCLGSDDIGIKIGRGETAARYRVDEEQSALSILKALLEARRDKGRTTSCLA